MTYNEYSYFNPMRYVCSAAMAVSSGLINGFKQVLVDTVDIDDLTYRISRTAKRAFENIIRDLNIGGGSLGELMDRNFNEFWDKLKFSDKFKRIAEEFNKAYAEALKNAKLADNVKLITDEIEKLLENIRGMSFRQFDGIRADFQQIFANMARDTTLKMVPWIALGSTITIGTPLTVSYIYYKAKHNIGKPKLATEVRYVGLYDRTVEFVSNAIACSWESSLTGLKAGTGAAALGAAAFIASNLFSIYRNGQPLSPKQTDEFGHFMLLTSLGSGAAAAVIKGLALTYKGVKGKFRKLEKPVFYKELNDTLEQITQATYNLQKNGGFFQNVLLYGPGGTGKTMISKFMAENSNMNYVMMSGADLAQYIPRGEHITELNKLFESTKKSSSPTILFIDEAESLCRNRDNITKPELIELQNAFLNHTGEASNKVMLIMATNRIEDLDPAVLSRMDHKLFIGPPKLNERKQIITNYLPKFFSPKETKDFFPEEIVGSIAMKTDGLTGRTIFKMLNAIRGIKNSTPDNKLTKEIITTGTRKFIEQEARAVEAVNSKTKISHSAPAAA